MNRLIGVVAGALLIALAMAAVGGKAWLELRGPFLESLPTYPYCSEAQDALDRDDVAGARELAEAGGCSDELAEAETRWNSIGANLGRCVGGIWTGRGDGIAGVGCAVASDLVVFGDVRDLTRQGIRWGTGQSTDPVLVALSAAGLALTFAPQVDAGNSLLKVARRAGSLTDGLASSLVALAKQRAWRPMAGLLGDAGRIARKLGPDGPRALAYADDAEELASLANFVDAAPSPLLALRWGGKGVARMADDGLYRAALARGPSGLSLAAERGSRALLSRQPLIVFAAKTIYRQPEAMLAGSAALATWLLRTLDWQAALLGAGALLLSGALVLRLAQPRMARGGRTVHARQATVRQAATERSAPLQTPSMGRGGPGGLPTGQAGRKHSVARDPRR